MNSNARIVSLVPSTTESVCALGGAAQLVGCTRYCTEPAAALQRVARVGGTKNPSREAIAALQPDLVLANAEENRADDLDWLGSRFRLLVQTPCTVDAAVQALRELGEAIGPQATAAAFAARIEAAVVAVRAAPSCVPAPRVFYAVWSKPWMGANASTFVHDVLTLAGADNVCAGAAARYPAVVVADLVAHDVDVVLLPDEPWVFDAAQRDALAAAGTFGRARLLLCSGRDFCWHGVHMAVGLLRAARLLGARRVDVT